MTEHRRPSLSYLGVHKHQGSTRTAYLHSSFSNINASFTCLTGLRLEQTIYMVQIAAFATYSDTQKVEIRVNFFYQRMVVKHCIITCTHGEHFAFASNAKTTYEVGWNPDSIGKVCRPPASFEMPRNVPGSNCCPAIAHDQDHIARSKHHDEGSRSCCKLLDSFCSIRRCRTQPNEATNIEADPLELLQAPTGLSAC